MKHPLLSKFTVAALIGAGWIGTAHADEASAPRGAGLMPLPGLTEPALPARRAAEKLPCGLFAIGPAAPRTAPVRDAAPLLSVQGEAVDRSRRIRHATGTVAARIRVLDGLSGRLITVRRAPIAERFAHALRPMRLDPVLLDQVRRARAAAAGPIAIDAEVLRESRLARALAAR